MSFTQIAAATLVATLIASTVSVTVAAHRSAWSGASGAGLRGEVHHGHGRACGRWSGFASILAAIERELALRPAQEGSWEAFKAAVSDQAPRLAAACREIEVEGPAPARLQAAERAAAVALGSLRALNPAFADFYAVLDRRQRAVIEDRLTPRRRG